MNLSPQTPITRRLSFYVVLSELIAYPVRMGLADSALVAFQAKTLTELRF